MEEAAQVAELLLLTEESTPKRWNDVGLFPGTSGQVIERMQDYTPRMSADEHYERSWETYSKALAMARTSYHLNDAAVLLHYYLERDYDKAIAMYDEAEAMAKARLEEGGLSKERSPCGDRPARLGEQPRAAEKEDRGRKKKKEETPKEGEGVGSGGGTAATAASRNGQELPPMLPIRFAARPSDLPPNAPALTLDGAFSAQGQVRAACTSAHWPGNSTPDALRRDLSTEIVFAFLDLPEAERAALLGGCEFICPQPLRHGRHLRALRAHPGGGGAALQGAADRRLAAAGDFHEVRSEHALALDAALRSLAGEDKLALVHEALELLGALLPSKDRALERSAEDLEALSRWPRGPRRRGL